MRRLVLLFLALSALGAVVSCNPIPDFSTTPEVKITSLNVLNRAKVGTSLQDTIVVELYFRDGDGDIGLDSSQKVGPFAKYLPDPANPGKLKYDYLNPLYDNLHISIFIENEGKFDSLPPTIYTDSTGTRYMQSRQYSGTIKPITKRSEPIEGKLKYNIAGYFYGQIPVPGTPHLKSGSRYYITAMLIDRERHVSNRVISDIMTAP